MAVLAMARIKDYHYGGEGLYLYLDIESDGGQEAFDVQYGPVDGDVSDVTLNADVRSFVRQYAISQWEYEFGLLDVIRLLNPIAAL